ncbi:MAG TPA: PilT/PilU family type 4a pilus ATPase [Gammaproteobacteria bacterium]|nr:PilT/PilU family type 4a pilus ATPase [Gammaproteobacteria bacterium]
MPRLDAFLKLAQEQGCSDLHLAVGMPPLLRMYGDLLPIKFRNLDERELQSFLFEVLTPAQEKRFKSGDDLDFSYYKEGIGRFRANFFHKSTGPAAAFRYIPEELPTIESLGLPPVLVRLLSHQQGMILITGSTGMGKSTTLAALINHLNKTRSLNIISLEDPIEFIHPSLQSQVIQREIGTHVDNFVSGLRSALREDPDVILVGELRDSDSIQMAMTAAETGHLVLGTLHTTSAVKSIDRIIDSLPAEQREQGKTFLAQSLLGVVTQVLVRTPDGHSRKAIFEVLVMNTAVAKQLMDNKTHMIPAQMQTGRSQGMQLMDQALLEAVELKEIDPDEAYEYALEKRPFKRYVTDAALITLIDDIPL